MGGFLFNGFKGHPLWYLVMGFIFRIDSDYGVKSYENKDIAGNKYIWWIVLAFSDVVY